MTRRRHPRRLPVLVLAVLVVAPAVPAGAHTLEVVWHPARPRVGDVAWVHVARVPTEAVVEGSVMGRPLHFFPYAGGQAALVGFDVETKPGPEPWRLAVLRPRQDPEIAGGTIVVSKRDFTVERLTLPRRMVDLDPETERRAVNEAERLTMLYRVVTADRLWRGPFTRPVAGTGVGTGFGARRVINGQRRAPHTGIDYAAPRGTPVVAANDGRVAMVADHFFPGRLVVLDHGLGLYTLYFHLEDVRVTTDERVTRGQTIGTVGATGRATGPHLHFGALLGGARIDPTGLLGLRFVD